LGQSGLLRQPFFHGIGPRITKLSWLDGFLMGPTLTPNSPGWAMA
jgi:hypothetical protein